MVLEGNGSIVGKSRPWKKNMNLWDYMGVDQHLRFELALWLSMSLLTYATLWNCYGMHFRQGNIHRYAFITVIWLSRHFVYRWICTSNRAGYYIRLLSAGHYFDVAYQQPPPSKQSSKKTRNMKTRMLQWIQPYTIALPIQWCIYVCTSTCIIWGYYVYLLQPDKNNALTVYPVSLYDETEETGGGEPSMLEILFRLSWWSVAMSILLYGRLLYPMMDLKLSVTSIPSYYYSEEGTGGNSSTVCSWNPSSNPTTLFFLTLIFGKSYVQHISTYPSQQQQQQYQQSVPWSEHYHSIQKTRIPIWKYHWHICLLRILDYMFTVAFMPTTHFACKATHHCNANMYNIYNRQDGDGDETYYLIPGVLPGWILLYMIFTFATSMLLAQMWTLHRSNVGWSLLQQQPKSRQSFSQQSYPNHPSNHHSNKQRRNRHHHSTTVNISGNHTKQSNRPSKGLAYLLQAVWSGEMIGASSSSQLMNQLNNIHICHALGLISLIMVFYIVNYFVFNDLPSPQVMPILLTSLLANYICCCALDTQHSSQIDVVSQEILSYANYRKEKN